MFKQQLIGTINVALPAIILFQAYPQFVFSELGTALLSLTTGLYLFYLNRKISLNMVSSFLYKPTAEHAHEFKELIAECGVNPETITINYAYAHEMIGMATFNNIVVDPIVWSTVQQDPDALKVKDVYDKAIEPKLSALQKTRLQFIKQALTPGAQRFIFKHELGHVYYNFSYKRLILVGAIGTLAAYTALLAARAAFNSSDGVVAIITGLLTGMASDLLLTYISNILVKSREEKKADFFAARYSTRQDIQAAADFFEQHQTIVDNHRDPNNKLSFLPSIVTSGHPSGTARARYLRKMYE